MKNRTRGGFTVVELLIVTVLGALVVGATYQVLIVNQRTYTAQNAQIQSQQTVRAGLDVLFGELRELSTGDGDIIAFGIDTLKVRVMRRFGLVCGTNIGAGTVDVLRVGNWFEVGDSVVIYAENDVASANDDDWFMGLVIARDTTFSCGAAPAQRLTIPAVSAAAAALDTVRIGASLRSFTHYTYGLFNIDGEPYLGRRQGTTATPLVGPLRSTNGLAFMYLDTLGAVTTTLANIAQVGVTLRTLSGVRGPDGRFVSDSIKTRIFARN